MISAMSEPHTRVMMLSVHPLHVNNILEGTKTVELRRTRPMIHPGQPVAIYATAPSAAVVATCRISDVEMGSPIAIWRSVQTRCGVSRADFNDYYEGTDIAVALHLTDVRQLAHEVALSHMRSQAGFHPPQTWHFLDVHRLTKLIGTHPSSPAITSLLPASS